MADRQRNHDSSLTFTDYERASRYLGHFQIGLSVYKLALHVRKGRREYIGGRSLFG